MRTTTFTELRQHAKTYFDYVEHGETVGIVRHGRLIAKIIPITEEDSAPPSWKKSALRLTIKGVSLSKTILKERREKDK